MRISLGLRRLMRAAAASGLAAAALGLAAPALPALAATPVSVVAAENFYGDVARQIGGPAVTVTSILSSPDQDPHLFEATPSSARLLARAQIVIANGAAYDPWIDALLAASPNPQRHLLVAATLIHRAAGDNPHLWYDPATMPAMAQALGSVLAALDPADAADIRARTARFRASLAPLDAKIAGLKQRFAGTPVTATEPVFGYMAAALGFAMRNDDFQRAVMNDTEPSASDLVHFEGDLAQHRVKLLLYNKQTKTPLTIQLLARAQAAKVPVVGVTETEPPGKTYQAWMMDQLDAVGTALAGAAP